uniref:Uncharacterized protein n=1 Tax=uncultured bacterium A1Q1_fos_91 TaxID=1256591 RepID=L7VVW9_9BACT|nr:hypothetical protein [uncultured bacterium A1Q1_fos_91]
MAEVYPSSGRASRAPPRALAADAGLWGVRRRAEIVCR